MQQPPRSSPWPDLDRLIVSSRPARDYELMFALELAALAGRRVLDCPGGASSFAAEAADAGADVSAVDPLYVLSAEELRSRLASDVELAFGVHDERPEIDSDWLAEQKERWRVAGERFFADYRPDGRTRRYQPAVLPDLPFADDEFDVALVSHLLFTYDAVDPDAGLRELLRVVRPGGTIRIHPLVASDGVPYPVERVLAWLERDGHHGEVIEVPYGKARGVGRSLIVTRGAATR
ncbi:MAG: methyltransferase domain-containing protein [Streptomycetaceae bacterium]|nr:methyltransferase domain-containing protein [Streptomycetaceae bacterium]